ncbi:MAG: hypothetical protein QXE50_05770 [Nitrososphaerota archaeon]
MNGVREKARRYVYHLQEAEKLAMEIGDAIENALKPLIPDISYSIGWEEAPCIDVIAFESSTMMRRVIPALHGLLGRVVDLEDIIEQEFPELTDHVRAPFGIYIPESMVPAVKAALTKIK